MSFAKVQMACTRNAASSIVSVIWSQGDVAEQVLLHL